MFLLEGKNIEADQFFFVQQIAILKLASLLSNIPHHN